MRDEFEVALARRIDERVRRETLRPIRLQLVLGCCLAIVGSLVVALAATT